MTPVGIGVDIVSLERVRRARYLDRVAEFVFLPKELKALQKSRDRGQFIGSRLAAKEAVIKAYPEVLTYHDVAIERDGRGLRARVLRKSRTRYRVFVSIAHEFNYAIGYAMVFLDG